MGHMQHAVQGVEKSMQWLSGRREGRTAHQQTSPCTPRFAPAMPIMPGIIPIGRAMPAVGRRGGCGRAMSRPGCCQAGNRSAPAAVPWGQPG